MKLKFEYSAGYFGDKGWQKCSFWRFLVVWISDGIVRIIWQNTWSLNDSEVGNED